MPILDQGINIFRFAYTFVLVYVIWPNLMFRLTGEDWVERFFTGFTRMVALTIVLVYLLVTIKLYELLSLFWILLAITVFLRLALGKPARTIHEGALSFNLRIFDFLDGRLYSFRLLQTRMRARPVQIASFARNLVANKRVVEKIMLTTVLLAAAYMRFRMPLQHAAPLMSDASTILAGVKFIDQRILFPNGIYPLGYNIYLSVLHKFSGIDVLYSLKYAGPLSGVLTTLGVYLFVRKLSGRAVPAIVAAFVFGVLGQLLPIEWERQSASNNQEFALLFLLPAWYYVLQFLETGRRDYLWNTMAAFAVIGFVHSLILAFAWTGLSCLLFAHFLFSSREGMLRIRKVLLATGLAGVIAALPLPLGLLYGRSFNSSATEFLTAKIQAVTVPTITNMDKLALCGLALFMLYTVWRQRTKPILAQATFISLTGIASFLMYRYLGVLTHNAVLITRMGVFWGMLASVGCGLGIGVILKLSPGRIFRMESVICFGLLAGTVIYVRPEYSQTYRMQYDSNINQYLRISREYKTTEWMMVSEPEGYALVLDHAWHMQLREFLLQYDPAREILESKVNGVLKIKDIFIVSEKNVYPVNFDSLKAEMALREKDYAELAQWIDVYKKNHKDLTVYYDDPDITVYQIHRPVTNQERNERVWGQSY